jgi:peptide/nickel transport system permease protein
MVLIIVFSVKLPWFPIGGARDPMAAQAGLLARVGDVAHHAILPWVALVLTNLPSVYFLMRNAMLGVLGSAYTRTARAKGAGERRVMLRHALPNALLPVFTMVAMRLGFMIMGAMFVEVVFAYPGMGTLIYQASTARDYPLMQGAFLFIMLFVLGFNLLAEVLYAYLDPRLRRA